MPSPADRMRSMRARRRARGVRELRLVIPDPRLPDIRARMASEVARLNATAEDAALRWIEAVSEFDRSDLTGPDAPG